jgi:hypothetical protein
VRITCDIGEVDLEGDYGPVPSTVATCSRCGHETESYGTSGASERRCLLLMREECPLAESNFYVGVSVPLSA